MYHLRDYRALLPGYKTSQKKASQAFLKIINSRVFEQGLSNKAVPLCLTQIQFGPVSDVYKIPALVNPGEVIQYINFNDKLNTFVVQTGGGMSLSHLKIRLEYYDGEILDLNGSEWNLTLSINNGKCDGGCSK